jgi:hypothetical protein
MLMDFQVYYETIARPFQWKFTRADLDELLIKIARHEEYRRQSTAKVPA